MHRVYAMFGRLCLLAVISLQSGCITVNLIEPSGPVQEVQLSGTGEGKVLLLDLSGVISSQDKDGIIPHPNMLATFKEELTRASKDDKVKAVVVRINSPGGTVTASDILYHELRDVQNQEEGSGDCLDDGCGGVRGLLPGHGGGQHFGPSLDGDGQYRRHHADRQCAGLAGKSGCRGQRHHVRPPQGHGLTLSGHDAGGTGDLSKRDRLVLSTVPDSRTGGASQSVG